MAKKKASEKLTLRSIVEGRVEQASKLNTKGDFAEAFQTLDEVQRRLLLDGKGNIKPYAYAFYRTYILTLFYLSAANDSFKALDKADILIDFFLRIF